MRANKVGMLSAAALTLAGCQGRYLPVDDAGRTTATPPTAASSAPAQVAASPPDTCGADKMQYLVGKPKTQIPVAVDVSKRRVICSTCMATMDFRPDRLDILFDSDTGKVTRVHCG